MKVAILGMLMATATTASTSVQLGKRVFDGDSKFVFECSEQTIPGSCLFPHPGKTCAF